MEPNDDLGAQMKQLNDTKQFKQSLSLFGTRKRKLSDMTDLSINQALKACIHLRDFRRGLAIHESLPPRSLKCRQIQMSLVQLYSESFSSLETDRTLSFVVRIGDVTGAQRVFASIPSQQRTPFLYTAMLNGNFLSFSFRTSVLIQDSYGIIDWTRHSS